MIEAPIDQDVALDPALGLSLQNVKSSQMRWPIGNAFEIDLNSHSRSFEVVSTDSRRTPISVSVIGRFAVCKSPSYFVLSAAAELWTGEAPIDDS